MYIFQWEVIFETKNIEKLGSYARTARWAPPDPSTSVQSLAKQMARTHSKHIRQQRL